MKKGGNEIISRREFTGKIWTGLGIIAGLEVLGLSFSFLFSSKNTDAENNLKSVGNVQDIPHNSVIPFRNGKFYLVRMGDGGIIALSLACTHLGCSITWDPEENKFLCPCHASHFNIEGEVLSPPAPRPLDYYPVIIEDGLVKVDTGRPLKRSAFNRKQLTYA